MSRANSVFVPENKVNEYLSKNDITLERMQNGITFVGVSRLVDDDNQAEVVLKFESGSYNDPSRIQGIHHLVEHLVLNRINKNPHATDVYHNAYTNYKNVSIILSGIANTKVTNYAIWPMIKHMARVIKDPLASKTLAKDLASEVKVVLNELYEKQADMKWHHYKFLNRCIYDPKNPICTDGLGNETTLSKISKEDIERILSELFIPKGLTVAVFTEGDSTLSKSVLNFLKRNLGSFPRDQKSPQIVDRSLEDLTNKEFSPGKFFKYDNGLSNKLVTITFVWKIDADDFTPQALALSRLLPVINEALFRHIRGKGLSYSSHVYKADHKKFKFVFIELTIPKNPNIEKIVTDEIFPDIKKNVLSKISDEDLSRINKKEKLIQEAAIISQRNRYDHLLYGLDVYKKIISVEAIREMYKVITIEHLKAWKKSLATTAPAIVVSGDID